MKYVIEYTEESWYRLEVEASSADEASEKFWSGEVDFDSAYQFGGEVVQDISVKEKKVSA